MEFKVGSHTFHLTLTAIALVVGGLFVFIKLGAGNETAINSALAGARQELAAHASWLQRFKADSDTIKIAKKKLVAANRTEAALVVQHNAYVAMHPTTVKDTDVAILMAALASCDSAKRVSGQISSIDSSHVEQIGYQAKELADTLHRVEQTEECHLIHVGDLKLFNCPSRVGAFKDGSIIGTVFGFVLRGI